MTFLTMAFADRLHLLHTLFKVIPKSIGLGRHKESRSGVLKLQMSVRRHSVIFPFDRPCTELYISTVACAFLLQSPGSEGLCCAPPHHIHLRTEEAESFGQILLRSQTHGAFFFLTEKFWSQNCVPDLIYSNYLTKNPSATLERATKLSSSNIYTYIQIYTIHSRRHKLRFQLI